MVKEEMRLINILAELCDADPADIQWDGSGNCDTVQFVTKGKNPKRFLLKLAQDNAGMTSDNTCDFRVRVIAMEDADQTKKRRSRSSSSTRISAAHSRATGRKSR